MYMSRRRRNNEIPIPVFQNDAGCYLREWRTLISAVTCLSVQILFNWPAVDVFKNGQSQLEPNQMTQRISSLSNLIDRLSCPASDGASQI